MNCSKVNFVMCQERTWLIIQRMKYLSAQMKHTAYLLSRENDPVFAQHGSELMNEVFLETAPNTERDMIWAKLVKHSICLLKPCKHCKIISSSHNPSLNNIAREIMLPHTLSHYYIRYGTGSLDGVVTTKNYIQTVNTQIVASTAE